MSTSRISVLQNIILLVAGSLLGAIVSIVVPDALPIWTIVALFLVVALGALFGFNVIPSLAKQFLISRRNRTWKKLARVGIFNDIPWDISNEEVRTWTDLSPTEWLAELKSKSILKKENRKVSATFIDVRRKFDRYHVIINPYGGVYPETDAIQEVALERIFSYVEQGGIFVNVADVPGYWKHILAISRKLNATPAYYDPTELYPEKRFFHRTPFVEKLGLRIINAKSINGALQVTISDYSQLFKGVDIDTLKMDRLARVERNIKPIVEVAIDGNPDKFTPLYFAEYGSGRFLISLYFIDQSRSENRQIKRVICDLIRIMN